MPQSCRPKQRSVEPRRAFCMLHGHLGRSSGHGDEYRLWGTIHGLTGSPVRKLCRLGATLDFGRSPARKRHVWMMSCCNCFPWQQGNEKFRLADRSLYSLNIFTVGERAWCLAEGWRCFLACLGTGRWSQKNAAACNRLDLVSMPAAGAHSHGSRQQAAGRILQHMRYMGGCVKIGCACDEFRRAEEKKPPGSLAGRCLVAMNAGLLHPM